MKRFYLLFKRSSASINNESDNYFLQARISHLLHPFLPSFLTFIISGHQILSFYLVIPLKSNIACCPAHIFLLKQYLSHAFKQVFFRFINKEEGRNLWWLTILSFSLSFSILFSFFSFPLSFSFLFLSLSIFSKLFPSLCQYSFSLFLPY